MSRNQPIKDHILPFLDYCEIEKGLSNNTQRNYRQYLRLFVEWLEKTENENLKPNELNAKQIILVSHESKIESFVDNVIRFNKKEHVSKIL